MREKRVRGQEKHEPLFDYKLDDFDQKVALNIKYDDLPENLLSIWSSSSPSKDDTIEQCQESSSTVELPSNPLKPISVEDPLDPEIYIGHHRRMEREERRMQVQERQQLAVMASRVKSQRELLTRPDWSNNIDKVVRIIDLSDSNEVKRKRELALLEIHSFLEKFEEFHKKCSRRDSKTRNVSDDSVENSHKNSKNITKKKITKSNPKPKNNSRPVKTEASSEPEPLFISFRPCAFGFMVPSKGFPPREFALPSLLVNEVHSHDLIDKLAEERSRLSN